MANFARIARPLTSASTSFSNLAAAARRSAVNSRAAAR